MESLLALNKIGAIGVLINSSLTGDPLIHCVNSSESSLCIVGAELAPAIEEVLNELNVKGNDKFLWVSDGDSYSLGIGRKISDDLSVSISGFYDGSSGGAVSELAPTGSTKTLSVGGKYAIADNADLSIGGSYSQRGDVLTGIYKASLTDSKVISLGAKLAFSF